jgi:predicted DNA-binding antitoxin AbrB/MazE fold protein
MTIDVDAVYEDGVLKPERPLALKEKAKVHVTIQADADQTPAAKDDDDPTGWKAAREFIGMWNGGTPGENVGEEHDKYIYGRK